MNAMEAVLLSQLIPVDAEDQGRWTNIGEYFPDLGVKNVVITPLNRSIRFLNREDLGNGNLTGPLGVSALTYPPSVPGSI